MEDSSEIEKLRKAIDEVDANLLILMNRRARIAKQIGWEKKICFTLKTTFDFFDTCYYLLMYL